MDKPNRKIGAAAIGGAFATAVVLIAQWVGAPDAPAGLEGALATLAAFAAGYVIDE